MGCAAKDVLNYVVIDVYERCCEVKLYSGDIEDGGTETVTNNMYQLININVQLTDNKCI